MTMMKGIFLEGGKGNSSDHGNSDSQRWSLTITNIHHVVLVIAADY